MIIAILSNGNNLNVFLKKSKLHLAAKETTIHTNNFLLQASLSKKSVLHSTIKLRTCIDKKVEAQRKLPLHGLCTI